MDLSEGFRFVNFGVGAFMILGAIANFFASISVQTVIIAVYLIVFGAATAFLELQIPPIVSRYANFMFSFVGRGVFYIFCGSVLFHDAWYTWVPGGLIIVVGLAYVALEFIPSIEPPQNMRDASWEGMGETV